MDAATSANRDGQREDFDPFSFEFRTDPAAFHTMLFERSPGFMTMDGVPSSFVATHAQCMAVLRDYKRFSSEKPQGLPGMQRIDFFNGLPVMNYSDPPDHTRRRQLVSPAFTRKQAELLNQHAARLVETLLDQAIEKRAFDASADFARPLAMDIMLRRFLGIADEDHHVLLDYLATLPLLDTLKVDDPKPRAFLEAWEQGKAYCRKQHELSRAGALNNLIGLIATSSDQGAISEDEMMAMMVILLTGGVATTAAAVTASLLHLARNPDLNERIRKDPNLARAHLEETLRVDPPVSLVLRFATADVAVGDGTIPKGMPVYVMNAAACHDPTVFPDPRRFDIDRKNSNAHIAFGYGIHTCIGNAIVRNVVPLVIQSVAQRMPNLRVAESNDAVEWDLSSPRVRHLKTLNLVA